MKSFSSLLVAALVLLPCGVKALTWDEPFSNAEVKAWKNSAKNHFSILWWNIEMGMTDQKTSVQLSDRQFSPLQNNLLSLIKSDARPDIIVLAENVTTIPSGREPKRGNLLFGARLNSLLEHYYPYRQDFFYCPNCPMDRPVLTVFSSIEPKKNWVQRSIPWAYSTDSEGSQVEDSNLELMGAMSHYPMLAWRRLYQRLSFSVGDQQFHLVPVHLIDTWPEFLSSLRQNPPKLHSQIMDFLKLMSSNRENPLAWQVNGLKAELRSDLSGNAAKDPVVLVGDFNIPAEIFLKAPKLFKNLCRELREASYHGVSYSWPASSSTFGENPWQVRIDHSFFRGNLEKLDSWVLPLAGSDHYPLYLILPWKKP
jgi:hypothetical protein